MSSPREVEVADVWREGVRVGTITRTAHGSVFAYDPAFHADHARHPGGIAVHLPYGPPRFETNGANLHPFFAGLLPEGLRLRVLIQRVKTSEDDLLSLLIAAGADTVGDISVSPHGVAPAVAAAGGRWKPAEVSFQELLQASLAALGGPAAEPTVPGIQEKISASTISFPLKPAGRSAAILKLNPKDKPKLVENEAFFMQMAKDCGVTVASTRLVHDRDGKPGLLVERFDRSWREDAKRMVRVHQEDACQFLDRYPADKYRLTCAEIATALTRLCVAPIPELARFVELVAFSYLIANGDLHAKNVSLLASGPGGGFRLAPAYDLLSTLPYGDQRMALRFENRDAKLRRRDFLAFGERFGLRRAATEQALDRLCDRAPAWMARLEEIGFAARSTSFLRRTIATRRDELGASRPR